LLQTHTEYLELQLGTKFVYPGFLRAARLPVDQRLIVDETLLLIEPHAAIPT
jgi:hypothetical protein